MLQSRWRPVALGIGVLTMLVVGAAVVERIVGYGKILPRVEVDGAGLSGLSTSEAVTELTLMAPELQHEPWVARHDEQTLTLDPPAIEYQVDAVATVDAARRQGRSRNPAEQLGGTLLRLLRPDVVPLSATWDDDRLDDVLDAWSEVLSEGLQNGGLRFEGATVVEVEPRAGIGLLREEAEAVLEDRFHSAGREEIELSVGDTEPAVDAAEVARAAAEARAILAEPVVLDVEGTQVTIAPEVLGPTMNARARGARLMLGIDTDALRETLAPDLEPVETPPVDATFAVDGTSVSVVPAVMGREVDLDAAAEEILAGEHHITATLRDALPARTTEWAESLNITELVSSFTTSYASGQPRVTNIRRAAEIVNDTIVEPGAVFSLNETLGPRTPERGFVEAGAFSDRDGFFETYGGGVSQFSTTLYNATFFGGYEIVEHTPHSIYISRYPMGREATLDYPGLDNVFRNDTDSGVLIRAYAGPSSVTVSYYGNAGGRVVESEGPNLLEEIPVEEELIETDWLPLGERRMVEGEGGFPGLVVEYFRVIKRPGEAEERQRFTWTYDMRPRKVLVGTAPPAPEPPPDGPPDPPPDPEVVPASVLAGGDQLRWTATSMAAAYASWTRSTLATRAVSIPTGTSGALTTSSTASRPS